MSTPQQRGAQITFTASSSSCPHPRYQFYLQTPTGSWTQGRDVSSRSTWTLDSQFSTPGVWKVRAWANEATSNYGQAQSVSELTFTINQSPHCATATITPTATTQPAGSSIGFSASSTGCPYPRYQYWVRLLDGKWYVKRAFSSSGALDVENDGPAARQLPGPRLGDAGG
jgi:hypothetical protein